MNNVEHIYHPMIARAATAFRKGGNYGQLIADDLGRAIAALPTNEERHAELQRIYVGVQFTGWPKHLRPALDELSLQVVRLLGGIAQLRAIQVMKVTS